MTRILCKKDPVEADAVCFTKVRQCFVGKFVAPLDDSEVLRVEVECKCNFPVFDFSALRLKHQYFTDPSHDICKSDHTTPLVWNGV